MPRWCELYPWSNWRIVPSVQLGAPCITASVMRHRCKISAGPVIETPRRQSESLVQTRRSPSFGLVLAEIERSRGFGRQDRHRNGRGRGGAAVSRAVVVVGRSWAGDRTLAPPPFAEMSYVGPTPIPPPSVFFSSTWENPGSRCRRTRGLLRPASKPWVRGEAGHSEGWDVASQLGGV